MKVYMKYIYIIIIFIIFLCVCLLCSKFINLYETFSVGIPGIPISTKLNLDTTMCNSVPKIKCTADDCNKRGTPSGNRPKCLCVDCIGGYTGEHCEIDPVVPPIHDLPILDQPDSTVQIINNTTEDFFHVFITSKTMDKKWTKVGGNGTIANPVNWKYIDPATNAGITWIPLGAEIASQIIIPKNGNIVLLNPMPYVDPGPGNPVTDQFKIIPMRLKTNAILKSTDNIEAHKDTLIYTQVPITIEAGEGAISNVSAVNGLNYKVQYELTSTADPDPKMIVKTMRINNNPCLNLDQKYHLDVGCSSPFIIDCDDFTLGIDPKASCECKPGTQNCKFNECSELLFNIPDDLIQYKSAYDGGKPGEPVKLFINDSKNLKDNSPQKKYCHDMQENNGDFDTYCYDYNDTNASPNLVSPYKIKLTYSEL